MVVIRRPTTFVCFVGDHSTAVVLPSPIRPTILATGRQDLTREGNLTRIGAASPTPTLLVEN